jgi:hypothetical protein
MPPSIIDILIKAAGQLPSWLTSHVDILIRATPGLGGVPPIIFLAGGLIVLFGGWQLINDKSRG